MYQGERFNSISHLVGAALALAGLVVLVVMASLQGDPWKIVSFSIYGCSLFLLYTFSTLYHSFKGKAKRVFQRLDHASIYLLIAGSYTPLTLVTLRGAWGWSLFGTIWGLAIIGILVDTLMVNRKRLLPLIIYIVMGWCILIALKPLLAVFPVNGFIGLIIGGLFYTTGIVFYVFDKRVPQFHGIWHLFVLAGSLNHYFTFFCFVLKDT